MRLREDPEHQTEEKHEDGEADAQGRDAGNGPPANAAHHYRVCQGAMNDGRAREDRRTHTLGAFKNFQQLMVNVPAWP